ncbi:MAG: ATP-binding protein [Fibrobacter sp.]|nr:ATP-binding protein [Fibrobacter sp.]
MDITKFENALKIGETVAVEFKRAGGTIESDTFETVCSFSNRFGGDIYLGVLDNGTVIGVPEKAAIDMVKNIINVVNNPILFQPTTYLDPEILKYKGKTIIRIHVPPSSEVHSFKRVVYDRVNESDVKVTSTSQIAQMYIRKQGIFTELRIYPYLKKRRFTFGLTR